jgi:hypothetical protein
MATVALAVRPMGHALASVVSFEDLSNFDGPSTVSGATFVAGGLTTGQRNPLGTRVVDDLGNEYIYLSGIASLAQGDFVLYGNNTASSPFIATRLPTAATFGMAAVAMSAAVATCFGWFQIFGVTPGPLGPWPSTMTAIANIATGSTDGLGLAAGSAVARAQLGPVTTKNIFNAVGVGTAASNVGQAFLTYPYEFGSATI